MDGTSPPGKRLKSHFGDIMGAEGSPSAVPALSDFTSLHRLVVTANGNLQRLVSSFHNTSVTVRPVYSRAVGEGRFEREVVLVCFDVDFAVATSTVEISRADCLEAITTGGVAIGQLFRHLNILPTFELLAAGYESGGTHFWRDYTLSGEGITCRIHERIRSDLFSLHAPAGAPPPSSSSEDAAGDRPASARERPETVAPSFGDIMSPNTTGFSLPGGFTPLQRVLLTANGNVERIVSSYYYEPLTVIVPLSHQRGSCVYDRQVTIALGSPVQGWSVGRRCTGQCISSYTQQAFVKLGTWCC